jgi:hypothetical protein
VTFGEISWFQWFSFVQGSRGYAGRPAMDYKTATQIHVPPHFKLLLGELFLLGGENPN